MARIVQLLVPCTDDFVGLFPDRDAADKWAESKGLKSHEYMAHHVISPFGTDGINWSRIDTDT